MRRVLQIAALTIALLTSLSVYAQEPIRQLKNLTIKDLRGNFASIPGWGKKYIILFYADPDRAGMNKQFTDDMEQNHRIKSSKIIPIGVINLKDSPQIPHELAYQMAIKRTEMNNVKILVDESRTISSKWELGDCNNLSVVAIVNPKGELIFLHKGVIKEEDSKRFYKTISAITSHE